MQTHSARPTVSRPGDRLSDRERYELDPTRRWPTRQRGISYRLTRSLDRSYFVYFKGKQIPAGVTEREALAKQAELRRSVARGERPILPTKLTFADLAGQWYEAKASRLRKRTARYYRDALDNCLLPRFGSWRISAIDADAISVLIRDLEQNGLSAIDPERDVRPLGRSSIQNYLKPLNGVLSLALRRGLVSSHPFAALTEDDRPKREAKKPAHEWSGEEVSGLLEASRQLAGEKTSKYDYTPLLSLVAALGLRLGEVLGLRWADFDKDGGYLSVERQWTIHGEYAETKTRASKRRIALPSTIRDDLIAVRLRSNYSLDEHPIFASRAGTPLGHRAVSARGFDKAAEKAGIEGVTFHSLRHAAASRLIGAAVDPVTVASVLGHEDATTTLRVYAHMFDRAQADEAVRRALANA